VKGINNRKEEKEAKGSPIGETIKGQDSEEGGGKQVGSKKEIRDGKENRTERRDNNVVFCFLCMSVASVRDVGVHHFLNTLGLLPHKSLPC
jgi:DNA replication initiation complex subunit (GINS family)